MEIIKLKNQGFCYGVTRAIKIAIDAANNKDIKKPIYLLGNIVHNDHINMLLNNLGIITISGNNRLEMLDEVNDDSSVIFSAHGVSDEVRKKAKDKHLHIIDATCPYVDKTFNMIKDIADKGEKIIYIGKKNHPETEAALAISPNVILADDALSSSNICDNVINVANQTTMSKYDIETSYDKLIKKYPNLKLLDMICKVTETRQEELMISLEKEKESSTLFIIIGDKNSNNSAKLYELAKRIKNDDAVFIEEIDELNLFMVKNYDKVILASGTSTPKAIIDEIYDVLINIDNINTAYVHTKLKPDDYK